MNSSTQTAEKHSGEQLFTREGGWRWLAVISCKIERLSSNFSWKAASVNASKVNCPGCVTQLVWPLSDGSVLTGKFPEFCMLDDDQQSWLMADTLFDHTPYIIHCMVYRACFSDQLTSNRNLELKTWITSKPRDRHRICWWLFIRNFQWKKKSNLLKIQNLP